MSDPFLVLGLPTTASEEQLRTRYLELVREFPPDRDPDKFAEIRAAYDALSNPQEQLRRKLFLPSEDSLDAVIRDLHDDTPRQRLPMEALLALGRGRGC